MAVMTRMTCGGRPVFAYALGAFLLWTGAATAQDTGDTESIASTTIEAEADAAVDAQTDAQPDAQLDAQADNPARQERRGGGGSTSAVVDEVIVNATKRNIDAVDLPLSVSALVE